jgi:pectate lyase
MNRLLPALSLLLLACLPAGAFPADLLRKPDAWFKSPEGRKTTACVLSWQSGEGSWPKNQDTARREFTGKRKDLKGTFDNKATTDELRYLAADFRATGGKRCLESFLLGLDHILKAQYPNGGWPQYFPPSPAYHRHITFNDGTMVRLMEFLREVATSAEFDFVDHDRRAAARRAFDRGLDCILKCQIIIRGTPTVWCAQHDEITLKPAAARAYELPSLSGSESAGIIRLLMTIDKPSAEIIRAVKDGAAWFESSKIEGIRIEKISGDRKVLKDPGAPPVWARFYDLESQQPFFCDRDGVKKPDLADIGHERRNGYAWYGDWGESLAKTFAKWPHR